jgi:glutamine---fructose-6-phosphate transaminase (isomerizing)
VKKTLTRFPAKKPVAAARGSNSVSGDAAQHTLREIFSQPASWLETSKQLEENGTLRQLVGSFSAQQPWLFVACGSSYYLSQLVAASWTRLLQTPCTAVPGSEFLFAPAETLRRTGARQVVLVSRSGQTTEVLRAATIVEQSNSIKTLGVTCNSSSPLEKVCQHVLKLTWADEKSMVMTRSFTSMLIAFERLAAAFAGDSELAASLDRLPAKTHAWLQGNADKIRAFGAKKRFVDFVFLGQGEHYWAAQEAALKMTEMSSSYAQVYHTLEFRHGPRSIASRDTLITFLLSDAAVEEEALLVRELKELGAATFVVANHATSALKRSSDLLIELEMDEPELARLAPTLISGHLLGAAVGLRKGLNPDAPRNLTRVVKLGANGSNGARRRNG